MAVIKSTSMELLEIVSDSLIEQASNDDTKNIIVPYTNLDLFHATYIFQNILLSKIYSLQESENMSTEDRMRMVFSCGDEIRKLIHTYTGIDTHTMIDNEN